VTAEGVETMAQHDFLTRIGCNELQGYLLSHPVEEEQIDAIFLGEKAAPESPVADAA